MAVEQAGGHANAFSAAGEGKIKKKVGKSEFAFYQKLETEYSAFAPFAPKCFGTEQEGEDSFVIMEDLTAGMKTPCIMDLKIGTSSAGEDVSGEKAALAHERDRNTTTAELGVRVVGMKYFDESKNDFVKHGKDYGKSLTKENLVEAIMAFFGTEENKKKVLPSVASVVEDVRTFMEAQTVAKIYSSSILVVYDADPASSVAPRTRIIDFAHVIPLEGKGRDEEYIVGINNLSKYFSA
mmetsp:Transcript_133300/g.198257  ORF Transcript_133300/g.198257 Transcript_133300/m.198257 type:complete len:238 (+) Transcript_133300:2-715(+)